MDTARLFQMDPRPLSTRDLARTVWNYMNAMDKGNTQRTRQYVEFRRVFEGASLGLVEAAHEGYVQRFNRDGREALLEMFGALQHMWADHRNGTGDTRWDDAAGSFRAPTKTGATS